MINHKLKIILNDKNDGYINLPISILKIHQNNFPFYVKIITKLDLEFVIGVKEFNVEENFIALPEWLMEHLLLNPFEDVLIKIHPKPPNLKYLSLQTKQKDFFDIPNYDTFLENHLSNFSTITINQIIYLEINNQNYQFNVIDLIGEDFNQFYSLVNQDINVDIKYHQLEQEPKENKKENVEEQKQLTTKELREQRLKYFNKK